MHNKQQQLYANENHIQLKINKIYWSWVGGRGCQSCAHQIINTRATNLVILIACQNETVIKTQICQSAWLLPEYWLMHVTVFVLLPVGRFGI